MAQMWFLRNETEIGYFLEHIARMRLGGQKPRVEFVDEKRSLDQNSMINALYGQIAAQKEDESVNDIRRHCKAYYGVPILLAENKKFAAMYEKGIMHHLTTEEKLEAMDILPVTRLFGKKQATRYIDEVIREYSKQGISLVNPNEAESYEGAA